MGRMWASFTCSSYWKKYWEPSSVGSEWRQSFLNQTWLLTLCQMNRFEFWIFPVENMFYLFTTPVVALHCGFPLIPAALQIINPECRSALLIAVLLIHLPGQTPIGKQCFYNIVLISTAACFVCLTGWLILPSVMVHCYSMTALRYN